MYDFVKIWGGGSSIFRIDSEYLENPEMMIKIIWKYSEFKMFFSTLFLRKNDATFRDMLLHIYETIGQKTGPRASSLFRGEGLKESGKIEKKRKILHTGRKNQRETCLDSSDPEARDSSSDSFSPLCSSSRNRIIIPFRGAGDKQVTISGTWRDDGRSHFRVGAGKQAGSRYAKVFYSSGASSVRVSWK